MKQYHRLLCCASIVSSSVSGFISVVKYSRPSTDSTTNVARFVQDNLCRIHNSEINVSNHNSVSESNESGPDQRIRLFFSDRKPFTVANFVMKQFMEQKYLSMASSTTQDLNKPLLNRKDGEQQFESNMSNKRKDNFLELYAPLFGYDNVPLNSCLSKKQKRLNFRLTIAYDGSAYCGWQLQPDNNKLPSVQKTLINILDPLIGSSPRKYKTNVTKGDRKPIDIRVCGRTDSGVSAIAQVCRVRTLQKVGSNDIKQAINRGSHECGPVLESSRMMPTLLCTDVKQVDELFHPTFDATCRAYAYLIDEDGLQYITQYSNDKKEVALERIANTLNVMLSQIEGLALDYFAMSYGKRKTQTTICTLFRARVSIVEVRNKGATPLSNQALCFELVGDRFLRRMVRILVATALREAIDSTTINRTASDDLFPNICNRKKKTRLLQVIEAGNREYTAKSAPPDGLIFVGAKFSSQTQRNH